MNQSAPKQATSEPALDQQTFSEMKSLMGDDFGELIDVYVGSAPSQIGLLKEALTRSDTDVITRTAHQIKGSSYSIGAMRVACVAEKIELGSHEITMDAISALVEELDAEYSRAEEALQKER